MVKNLQVLTETGLHDIYNNNNNDFEILEGYSSKNINSNVNNNNNKSKVATPKGIYIILN